MHSELDKPKLLALIAVEYDFVLRTLDLLTPEQQTTLQTEGNWTPKDMLCHLVRWLNRLQGWVADAERGVRPELPEAGYTWQTMDALNDVYVEQDREIPLDRVRTGFQRAHEQTVALLERLSPNDLFDSTFGGAFDEPLIQLVVPCTCEHYAYHVKNLRESLIALGIQGLPASSPNR